MLAGAPASRDTTAHAATAGTPPEERRGSLLIAYGDISFTAMR